MLRSLTFAILLLLVPIDGAAGTAPLAESLIPSYAGTTEPTRMDTLMRLQLAAGRWREAEATIERLAEFYRPIQPPRAHALIPWRIYARSRRYETEGVPRARALERAFSELYGSLSDREAALAYGWFAVSTDRLRERLAVANAACRSVPADRCADAADMIAARQSVVTWTYILPAAQASLRADLERRFLIDDLLIPMPDGARIAAILVRPRGVSMNLTALLEFTIYARDESALSDAVEMAGHGYAGIVAYSRGKGRSPGSAVPYEHDGADAAAVIDWLAAQPWSDGRVGMFSGSYNAATQWGALKHRPSALKAIATNASNAPGIDTPMQGNVFLNFTYPWPLYTTDVPGLDEINYGDQQRWTALNRNWYTSGRRYRDLPLIDGVPNSIFEKWLDHPAYDTYWQRFIPVGDEFAAIDIPVFVQTGYFDGGMVGALHYFREHVRHRPNADHRMLIGPYHHVAMGQGVLVSVNGYEVDRAAMIDLRAIRMQWFDHVFRGAPLPDLLRSRINYQVMGANRWRHVQDIDGMADERRRLFLTTRTEGGMLLFADSPDRSRQSPILTVDLADRSDADLEVSLDGLDRRNALVFGTGPFEQPLEVAGAFTGRFEIVTNKRDIDLSVALFEQTADGRYFPLASYLGRASYMADRTRRTLLTPGRPQVLWFESQSVTARRIGGGSRILAVVGIPRQPDTQINYGTGGDVGDESIADAGEPVRLVWRPGSFLDLGVRRKD